MHAFLVKAIIFVIYMYIYFFNIIHFIIKLGRTDVDQMVFANVCANVQMFHRDIVAWQFPWDNLLNYRTEGITIDSINWNYVTADGLHCNVTLDQKNIIWRNRTILNQAWNTSVSIKGRGWECYIKYKEQDWFPSFPSMQQIYRCQLTVVAW